MIGCFKSVWIELTWFQDFAREPGCVDLVKQAFGAMDSAFAKGDYATLNDKFKLCKPISDQAGYHH